MPTVKQIIETNDTKYGRLFDLSVQTLVVLSIISFSVETLPNLSSIWQQRLHAFEVLSVTLFSIEYVLRIWVAQPKRKFVFSFFGIVDLVAILPFYIGLGIDLRAVRLLRLLRIFRIFKLGRYSAAVQRFHRALVIAKEEIILFLGVSLIVLYLASVGIYYFEREAQPEHFASVFHSMWWALITLTTVGYGDVYPITTGGRIFTFFVLFVGLGVVSVPAGLLASALTKAREMENIEK